MRELSIEEKAKAYDKVSKEVKDFFEGRQKMYSDVSQTLEYLFPELKESEDEKIRKDIIFYIKAIANNENISPDSKKECKTWIAWLEKQGNSPIKWNKNTEGNKPKVNHSVLMKTTNSIAEGEWKGEYWEQYRWAGIVRDSDVLSWMELSDLDKQGEQKPTLRERYKNIAESEWFKKTHEGMSVSDDEKVDNVNKVEPRQEELTEFERAIKQVMEEAIECGDTHNLKADADMLLRIAQKSAWSEEDERNFNDTILFIETGTYSLDKDNLIKWLKSLKNKIKKETV